MLGYLSNELNQDLLPGAFFKLSRSRLHVNAPFSPSLVWRRGKAGGLVEWRRACVGGRLMSLTHSWRASRRPRHGREQGCAEAFSHDAWPPSAVLSVAKTLRILHHCPAPPSRGTCLARLAPSWRHRPPTFGICQHPDRGVGEHTRFGSLRSVKAGTVWPGSPPGACHCCPWCLRHGACRCLCNRGGGHMGAICSVAALRGPRPGRRGEVDVVMKIGYALPLLAR